MAGSMGGRAAMATIWLGLAGLPVSCAQADTTPPGGAPSAGGPTLDDGPAADVSGLSDECRAVILRLRDSQGLARHYAAQVNGITVLAQTGARQEACMRTLDAMREYDGMRQSLLQCRDEIAHKTTMAPDRVTEAAAGVTKLATGFGELGRVAGCTGDR